MFVFGLIFIHDHIEYVEPSFILLSCNVLICYAPNFEKVEGAYCFGLVCLSFRQLQIYDRVFKGVC